ncbi:VOC family protein [Microgenomates group bacterium]|nr:VOC family protein [Microgenomates group bacterium]
MNLLPYLNFNGNCADAIAFYEKVFNAKAEIVLQEDAVKFDASYTVPKGKEKWIMHANMNLDDGNMIQFADCEDNAKNMGTNICLQLTYKTEEEVKAVYDVLKSGGRIICEMQPTFYAPQYAELIDKFGIRWSIMQNFLEQ